VSNLINETYNRPVVCWESTGKSDVAALRVQNAESREKFHLDGAQAVPSYSHLRMDGCSSAAKLSWSPSLHAFSTKRRMLPTLTHAKRSTRPSKKHRPAFRTTAQDTLLHNMKCWKFLLWLTRKHRVSRTKHIGTQWIPTHR